MGVWGKGENPFSKKGFSPSPSRRRHTTMPKPQDPLASLPGLSLWDSLLQMFRGERPLRCIQVEVTSHCPGRCTYCPHTMKKDVWRSRHMDAAVFAALWPMLRHIERVHLQGWGEPLLHPRFGDFVDVAARAGCAASTTTCGLGMTDRTAAMLAGGKMDMVAFSLTGTDEESNASREGIPFSTVVAAIRALREAKEAAKSRLPALHLAYLLLASGLDAVRRLPELMQDLGVPVAVVSTLDYIAAPGMEKEAFAPHERDKIAEADAVLRAVAAEGAARGLSIHYSLPSPVAGAMCSEQVDRCLYMDAEGQLSPCIYVNLPTDEEDPQRRVFGKLDERPALEIWNGKDFKEFRQRLAAGDPDLPCRHCPKRFEPL